MCYADGFAYNLSIILNFFPLYLKGLLHRKLTFDML